MTPTTKGFLIAALHVVLVCGLGAKLLIDRAVRPRVWVEVAPYDPDLPIRGRYVRLQVVPVARGFADAVEEHGWGDARLSVEQGRLIATRCDSPCGEPVRIRTGEGPATIVLATPVAYFIPEHVPDPSSRPGLVAEVTVPRKGPPRPIRLGVKEGERITPIELRD